MRRVKTYVAIGVLFLIQLTCIDLFDIANCKPNLLLVFCICFSVMSNLTAEGLIAMAVCGFLADVTGAFPWGVSAIAFSGIYILCSLVGSKFYRAKLPISILFAFVVTFIYESGGYLALMVSGTEVTYGISIARLILPTCLYHMILTLILYWITKHYFGNDLFVDAELS